MGQMLEKPISVKESDMFLPSGSNQLAWASSCMQGWRSGMEDDHITLPELPKPWGDVAMFGVLDGHGGEQVAKFCARHLPKELHTRLCDARPWANGQPQAPPLPEGVVRQALTDSFHEMDELLRSGNYAEDLKALTNPPCREGNRPMRPPRPGLGGGAVDVNMIGCTCNICCVTPEFILCANAGDSRAVLCRGGRAVALSEDHKPNSATEERRIKAAGGYVETQHCASGTQYRVNGNLNLSRALGDLEYKKDRSLGPEAQIISGTPDFICERRCAEDEFMVICCDGVWDVKNNQQVVDFVRTRLPDNSEAPQHILEELLDACLSPDLRATKGLGGDNMTAVLVRFQPSGGASSSAASASIGDSSGEARLLSAKVEDSSASASNFVVRLSLPPARRAFAVGFCERTGELEVAFAGASQKFSLKAHVPEGATLRFPSAEPSVKFFPKSSTLRVTLPCG